MKLIPPAAGLSLLLIMVPAAAQHGGHHGRPAPAVQPANPAQPYAGLHDRRIKALSDREIADLLAGRGMALALAAELNGYPGPMHVLEHADALRLSPAQRATAEALRQRMLAEAGAVGARLVALEEELDRLFARGAAETGPLAALTAAIGATQGRLREVHLTTHIAMREAMTPDQRRQYDVLRGYAPAR